MSPWNRSPSSISFPRARVHTSSMEPAAVLAQGLPAIEEITSSPPVEHATQCVVIERAAEAFGVDIEKAANELKVHEKEMRMKMHR